MVDFQLLTEETLDWASKQKEALNILALIDEGGEIYHYPAQPCYAALKDFSCSPANKNGIEVFIDRSLSKLEEMSEKQKEWMKWVVNDSYFSLAFARKDVEDIYNRGAVFNTDYPARYVVGAAMYIRVVYEYPYIIDSWHEFRKYMHPDIAAVFAHEYSITDYGLTKQGYLGHRYWDSRYYSDTFDWLVNKKIPDKKPFRYSTCYASLTSIFPKKGRAINTGGSLIVRQERYDRWNNRHFLPGVKTTEELVSRIIEINNL